MVEFTIPFIGKKETRWYVPFIIIGCISGMGAYFAFSLPYFALTWYCFGWCTFVTFHKRLGLKRGIVGYLVWYLVTTVVGIVLNGVLFGDYLYLFQ